MAPLFGLSRIWEHVPWSYLQLDFNLHLKSQPPSHSTNKTRRRRDSGADYRRWTRMSSSPQPAPRRSARDRKRTEIFSSDPNALKKRKRSDAVTDDDNQDDDDQVTSPDEDDSDKGPTDVSSDEGEGSRTGQNKKQRKRSSTTTKTPKASTKLDQQPKTKKPRVAKAASSVPKRPAKGSRKAKNADSVDTEAIAKQSAISNDNALFNAILNPSAALQSTAEDFLDSYSQSPASALADLINCVLRACGCNGSVNSDEVVDSDGVVDSLDTLMEGVKKETVPSYPLVSKLPIFRKFRKSLAELFYRIIVSSAETGALYDEQLIPTLQTWVIAMSSSHLRSFRHTATVVALEVESALAEVAASVDKEAEVVRRQKEGEKKKKGSSNAAKGKGREQELQATYDEVMGKRAQLKEYLKEFFDGLFVLRYRDADPGIRAECVQEFGVWLDKYPAYFLEGNHLRYLGWVLSDLNTQVRLAAVKALTPLYTKHSSSYLSSTNHFTQRYKPRLVDMATSDIELSVRVAVIQILCALDDIGELDEDQVDELSLLIFDKEAKVRKAVAGFVGGVWKNGVESRMVGMSARGESGESKDKLRVGFKVFAELIVKWSRALEKDDEGRAVPGQEESQEGASDAGRGRKQRSSITQNSASSSYKSKEVAAIVGSMETGRIALAVESLWDELDVVGDWEGLLEYLLLDHSAPDNDAEGGMSPVSAKRKQAQKRKAAAHKKGGGRKNANAGEGAEVEEAWRLKDEEEAVLVEVLVAALKKTVADAKALAEKKKSEGEEEQSNITRMLIKALPRLFAKHQADERRIAEVLVIPQLMNLDLYLEMRMVTAYESLWDDVIKQFVSHTSPVVLRNAVQAISHLLRTTCLSNTNSSKIVELEDDLASSLRDVVAGRDDLDVVDLSEDDVRVLGGLCLRIEALFKVRNMTGWIEEDEGGKSASAWVIMLSLAERGRRGYREEEMMVDHAFQLLTLHITWKLLGMVPGPPKSTSSSSPASDAAKIKDTLKEQRDTLVEKLTECALGTASRPCENVKRSAFICLLMLHTLFLPNTDEGEDAQVLPGQTLPLKLSDEMQHRYAGFVEAELETYADELADDEDGQDGDDESDGGDTARGSSSGADENEGEEGRKKSRKRKPRKSFDDDAPSQSTLEREYTFTSLISSFVSAVRAGAINVKHTAVPLVYYGRLGDTYDQYLKVIVEILREEGMYKGNGRIVAEVMIESLKQSFEFYLDGRAPDDSHTLVLTKALSSALLIRGAQLAVVRRLDGEFVKEIHTSCITWIVKKIAHLEGINNKKRRNSAIEFFRVLLPLLGSLETRDATELKQHLDSALASAKLEPSATAKFWEPYRAYDRKLTGATTKEQKTATGGKGGKPRKSAAKVTVATSDEEGENDDEVLHQASRPAPTRRQPRRSTRGSTRGAATTDDEAPTTIPSPPKPRPRPRRRARTPVSDDDRAQAAVEDNHVSSRSPRANGHISPTQAPSPELDASRKSSPNGRTPRSHSKKRPRNDPEDLNMDEDLPDMTDDDEASPILGRQQHSKPPSQISQLSQLDIDFFKTRKRIRR
ncbi:hypothetical protein FRC03_010340 [Tulasnella sp. 419]|nr:hypothetical protein FRC03_010340 [Tulasnella sp. 419]